MTVHKAKGLEFPVVILADITARLTPYDASRHIDASKERCALRIAGWSPKDLNDNREIELLREQKEGERVAYVAATRARDLLIVPAVGDDAYADGWVAPLNQAIYPPDDARRVQKTGVGCPAFKSKDSVLNRPDGDPATKLTVCPGEHTIGSADGAHAVVWWSPEPDALALDAKATFGLRREDLIVKDVAPATLRKQLDEYASWRTTHDAAVAFASQASIDLVTATQATVDAELTMIDGIDVQTETVTMSTTRPGGARFGALVHALLADVPLGSSDDALVSQLARAHGRVLGAEAPEVAAAEETVRRVLAHSVLRSASSAAGRGGCYRETPVTLRLETGALVEGNVDLAYLDEDGFVVVDFKTDRAEGEDLARYKRQVALYAAAISRATKQPVRAVLMQV
jgi:ATP-dependent exoDNAse (exonuclease V) beta subunit